MNHTAANYFNRFACRSNLVDAWDVVRKKGKAGGIDLVSVESYQTKLAQNIDALLERLQQGKYLPEPYFRIDVPKDGKPGETRALSLPTIEDKIVQQALRTIIEPAFDKTFINASYAYRNKKGPVKAISRIRHEMSQLKNCWVAIADIDSFYDNIDHAILLGEFEKIIPDPHILKLIRMWLKIGTVTTRGEYKEMPAGTAQGGIISPLLSNIYLNVFDRYIVEKSTGYVRYADNFIVLASNREQITKLFAGCLTFLKETLKLRVNPQKKHLFSGEEGFTFMGIFFRKNTITLDRSRLERLERQLKKLVEHKLLADDVRFRADLDEKITGFERYYGKLGLEHLYPQLNQMLGSAVADFLTGKKLARQRISSLLKDIRLFGGRNDPEIDRSWQKSVIEKCLAPSASRQAAPAEQMQASAAIQKQADQAVRTQKARYQKLERVSREVLIQKNGVFIGKNHKCLVVKERGVKILEHPLEKIENVTISCLGASLSVALIRYCRDNGKPLFFSDNLGMPYCVLQDPIRGDADLGLLQLQTLNQGEAALDLAKEFIEGKIRNQINLLKFYRRSRDENSLFGMALQADGKEMKKILPSLRRVKISEGGLRHACNQVMGYEANAAARYWRLVKILLADAAPAFPGRVRKGAADLVNSLLNYGYGFLYRQVWQEIIKAGLNPKISFLHSPQGEKPTLAFDLVEEFRPQAVDRVVFSMLTRGEQLKLSRSGNLHEETRKKLLEGLLEQQGTAMKYRGERVLLKNIMKRQILNLKNHLRGEENYRFFVGYY